ncbi:hypothetical protein D3C85_1171400 [compost metagenome]
MLNDSDFLDMLNVGDNETPEWLQEMITSQAQTSGFTTNATAAAVSAPQAEADVSTDAAQKAPQTAD